MEIKIIKLHIIEQESLIVKFDLYTYIKDNKL